MAVKRKKPRHPKPRPMPKPINASPEEAAEVVLRQPPKKRWRYLEPTDGETPKTEGS